MEPSPLNIIDNVECKSRKELFDWIGLGNAVTAGKRRSTREQEHLHQQFLRVAPQLTANIK